MPDPDLLAYWPTAAEVDNCVKSEAETSSEAVSLAVHQPMRFERRVAGAQASEMGAECDEKDLLDAFLTTSLPEGRVILPIVGSSGVGKSHVVRWLDAQLRRAPGAERRVVIRIPKGTSLKGVLGILLDQLQDPAYETYRTELRRAQQQLDRKQAAGLLCETLAQTLEEMFEQARDQLRTDPNDKEALERQTYCQPAMLPALLRAQVLRDSHFVTTSGGDPGVVARLVEHLTEERPASEQDDRVHMFTAADLLMDGRVDRSVLGRSEQRALIQIADREDRRVTATRLLNTALDEAKQRLLKLDPTVSDLFDEVRRDLLRDGKELVLLVEDFAVLSGLQRQLLQIIIKEAVRDGHQVLCTIRTALAYTTGYMVPATVLTRAGAEYRIPDEPGTEEQILDRVVRLVGAYLNAARLGQERLESAFRESVGGVDARSTWLPRFDARPEPEARATLAAFGVSEGYELFPFNEPCIRELAREGCRQGDRLVYNPRFVIKNVIDKVLAYRDLFERGAFPPEGFGTRILPARVQQEVDRRTPAEQSRRYARFLAYWGGAPQLPEQIARLDPRLFVAFGLDAAPLATQRDGQGAARPTSSALAPTGGRPSPPQTPPSGSGSLHEVEARWDRVLEAWRNGVTMPQADANQLRKWLGEALQGFLSWDWLLFRPRANDLTDSFYQMLFIPRAMGNQNRGPDESMATPYTEEDLSDPARSARAYAQIMAVVRYHGVHDRSWDYEGGDSDMPAYAALLERLAPRVRDFLRARYFRVEWDPIPTLVVGLLVGARALGLAGAERDDDLAGVLSAVFAGAPGRPTTQAGTVPAGNPSDWARFKDLLAMCRQHNEAPPRNGPSWTSHLLNLIGARQGGGEKVHAVDVLRLKAAVQGCLVNWALQGDLPTATGVPDYATLRQQHLDIRRAWGAIAKAQSHVIAWRKRLLEWVGEEDFDKDELVRVLKETAEKSKAQGIASEVDYRRLLDLIETVRKSPLKAALTDAAALAAGTPTGAVLAVLGHVYNATLIDSEALQEAFDTFLEAAEADAKSHLQRYGADPMGDAITSLDAELALTEELLQRIQP